MHVVLFISGIFAFGLLVYGVTRLITGFIAYIGLTLYIIIAFANLFLATGHASTAGFERFLTSEVRAMPEGSPDQVQTYKVWSGHL